MVSELKRVIFDPISWVHNSRMMIPTQLNTVRCRSILNDILIKEYGLSTIVPVTMKSIDIFLVGNWSVLVDAAIMTVCYLHRAEFAYSGKLFTLDNRVQEFLLCKFHIDSNEKSEQCLNIVELHSLACQILISFSSSASFVIRERIPFLFPMHIDGVKCIADLSVEKKFILRMAVQYAKSTC